LIFFSFHIINNKRKSFGIYPPELFTDLLINEVDDLNYKIILTSERIDGVQQVSQDGGLQFLQEVVEVVLLRL
jgi:hypothetical protein